MANSEELNGATEYLKLQASCRIKQCRFNRVGLYPNSQFYDEHCCSVFGLPSFHNCLRNVCGYE
jgi:hypothetical protein